MSDQELDHGEGQLEDSKENVSLRLLEESKLNKKKAQELKQQNEELLKFKQSKLEEEGKFRELLESERGDKEKLQGEMKALRDKVLKSNIVSTITKYAQDVNDIEDLINQPKFAEILKGGLDLESLTLSDDAAQDYVKKVTEAKPWLKKPTTQAGFVGGKPKGDMKKEDSKPLDSMSKEELLKLLKTK